MDVLQVLMSVGSGVVGAASVLVFVGRKLEAVEAQKKAHEELKREFDELVKEEQKQWREMARTLGGIEAMMSGANRMRPKLPSRPE
jgi:hypothetical protein